MSESGVTSLIRKKVGLCKILRVVETLSAGPEKSAVPRGVWVEPDVNQTEHLKRSCGKLPTESGIGSLRRSGLSPCSNESRQEVWAKFEDCSDDNDYEPFPRGAIRAMGGMDKRTGRDIGATRMSQVVRGVSF
jgi:hypothetical protein